MTSTPTRPVDNVVIATDRNTNIIAGTTVENKGKKYIYIYMHIYIYIHIHIYVGPQRRQNQRGATTDEMG